MDEFLSEPFYSVVMRKFVDSWTECFEKQDYYTFMSRRV
jgi:hypothetical protein